MIIIGKVAGANFAEGVSKAGSAYKILSFSVCTATKSVFDGMPKKISVFDSAKVDVCRAKLLGMKPGDAVAVLVDVQDRAGANGQTTINFVDWFDMSSLQAAK